MKRVIIFGEAFTYPAKEGITAHIFSTLEELASTQKVEPIMVMADRGFFDINLLNNLPWKSIIVTPDTYYDLAAMREIIAELKPDILQCYNVYHARLIGTPLAEYLNIPLVFEHHDLETELTSFLGLPEDMAQDNRRYQDELLHFASLNRVMSKFDYDSLVNTYKDDPVVLNQLKWLPVSQTDIFGNGITRESLINGVFFVGNGGYPPNIQAIEYILEELAPQNRSLHFHIVGRFTEELCKDYPFDNVTGHGQLDDLSEVVGKCFVGIIPISAGSGMKVKILTYLSAGIPVIGSSVAFHGYDMSSFLLKAETPGEYKKYFSELLEDDAWKIKGVQARHYFDESFNASTITAKLVEYYDEITEKNVREHLEPISRNDLRLAWIHESREKPYEIVSRTTNKGFDR